MDNTTSAGLSAGPRRPNARGQGERLREQIISAAVQMLGDLADDEALSLRAVARAVSISPTSVYLYFPDRDALVAAAMQRCHAEKVLVCVLGVIRSLDHLRMAALHGRTPGPRSRPARTDPGAGG